MAIGFEKGSYRDFLFGMIVILKNTKNYNQLANSIFNGLDMYNNLLLDGNKNLTEAKKNGIEIMRSIAKDLKDEDVDKIREIVCEIFVNANRHFMGSRVIQHVQSRESRCFYLDWDSENNVKDEKNCKKYLERLAVAILDDEVFSQNVNDIDKDIVTLAIEQPNISYELTLLKKHLEKNKTCMKEETRNQILFHLRFFPNKLTLDYLNEFLPLLLNKGNLNENIEDKLYLISQFWRYNSSWCNKYEGFNHYGESISSNPNISEYEWFINRDEPDRLSYHLLKKVLNRIIIHTASLDKESIEKLNNSIFLGEVQKTSKKPHFIKQLIANKINKVNQ